MIGYGRGPSVCVPELAMGTSLMDKRKAKASQNPHHLARLENGGAAHELADRNSLCSYKLSFQLRLAVFKKHGDNFLKIIL